MLNVLFAAWTALMLASTDEAKNAESSDKPQSFYSFSMKDIDGKDVPLSDYEGKVCLVVNVASKCGLTPQYAGLQKLQEKYGEQGFRILGFPANNFMGQEPGSNADIKKFCTSKYDVTFDMFSKVSVKGKDQCDLYHYLTNHPNEDIAGDVQWNFQKYLVDREGNVIAKFGPRTKPNDEKLTATIEKALEVEAPAEKKS